MTVRKANIVLALIAAVLLLLVVARPGGALGRDRTPTVGFGYTSQDVVVTESVSGYPTN